MTLLEVMVALGLFVIGGLGVAQVIGFLNRWAALDRSLSAARLLVSAKIAKAQTDTFSPSSNVRPMACWVQAQAVESITSPTASTPSDPHWENDAFDYDGTGVPVISSDATGTVVQGTLSRTTQVFEAVSNTVLITYSLQFTFQGKPYTVSQSTIRAPDLL